MDVERINERTNEQTNEWNELNKLTSSAAVWIGLEVGSVK